MSLILDALERDQQSKRAVGNGELPSQQYFNSPSPSSDIWKWAALISIMVTCILAGVFIWYGTTRSEQPDVVVVKPEGAARVSTDSPEAAGLTRGSASAESVIAAERDRSLAVTEPPRTKSADGEGGIRATTIDSGIFSQPNATPAISDSSGTFSKSSSGQVDRRAKAKIAELYSSSAEATGVATSVDAADDTTTLAALEEKAATAAQQDESMVDLEAAIRRAQAEMGEAPLSAHPVPLIENMSQSVKDRIPSLMYQAHDYNPREGSVVVINGEAGKVGERVKGFLVEEILEDSAVFNYAGTQFRLRALNSWVNL